MTLHEWERVARGRMPDWPAMVKRYRAGASVETVASEFGYDVAYTGWVIATAWHATVPQDYQPQCTMRALSLARWRRVA